MGVIKLEEIINQRSEENPRSWNLHTYWEHKLRKNEKMFNNFIQYVILDLSLDYRHLEGKLIG